VSAADPRVHRAAELLARHGIPGEVSVEGHEGEIAALWVPADAWSLLVDGDSGPVAREVKALGFRYVAVDLLPAGE
jgi:PP-loop superfamily ATP-utilizing enzyme